MTGKIEHVEVITSVQRRRRWSAEEKAAIVQETYPPGMSVSLVARRHGIAPNQLISSARPGRSKPANCPANKCERASAKCEVRGDASEPRCRYC
jgi:transposase-like protein